MPRRWRDRDEADEPGSVTGRRRSRHSGSPGPQAAASRQRGAGVATERTRQPAGSVAALGPFHAHRVRAALFEQQLTLPFGAPKTMFNVPIGGARRTAAQSWPIKRFLAIKGAAGVTLNDVVSPCAQARFARI